MAEGKIMKLRAKEFEILKALDKLGGRCGSEELKKETQLEEASIMRIALSLSSKNLISIKEEEVKAIELNDEGKLYARLGLPERRLVKALLKIGGKASLKEAALKSGLEESFLPIVLGWIKRKDLAEIKKQDDEIFLEAKGFQEIDSDEELLKLIDQRGKVEVEGLKGEYLEALKRLKSRNLIISEKKILREFQLTDLGSNLVKESPRIQEEVTALTTDLILSGKWKEVKLIEYDVEVAPPTVFPGKKQIYTEFMEEARRILLSMGFEEYEGPLVETEFWNFDLLFQAQDHPAREIHGSYLVKNPAFGDIEDQSLMEKVKKTHENGWITGSSGWGYRWNPKIAKRLVLRTQTTAVSMRYLSTHKKAPIKMFCLSRVFRPDVLDAKHSMEFTQLEGIVGDYGITIRHLMGFLKEFSKALGLGEVKFKPSYFPFTEPSIESFVKHPVLGWVEFVGSGMFRPEVLKPLGIDFPVIAWGIGFDRLAMIRLGINDIRDLYSKRLDWLRKKALT
ncbi:MAG: phenylalanine--tRNA ligase subunit alpha [Candidatus Bathyarchaeia archaeon]